ncbi:MAG: hypothetical protein ACM31P_17570 [Actinomycetota bacterium]
MERRKILKGIAALAAMESVAGIARAMGNRPVKPGVYRVSGQVSINGKPAQEGMAVAAGDTIVTGPGSEVIYVVGQDAFLQRDNSTVSLVGEGVKTVLRIFTGKLLSVFAKGDKRIETATATIGIRGTGCYIESAPERVYFCLCYGRAEVSPLADPGHIENIETRHHDHPIYIHRDGQRMMVPATVANHTDAELTLLEGLVGRYPPFYGQSGSY